MAGKIYFSGSIRAGREDVELYSHIVDMLSCYGKVITPFVADKRITATGPEHPLGDKGIHDTDVELLQESKVVIAEVTRPSLGVGYEIGRAVDMGKPILCLYRPAQGRLLSAMIRGLHDGGKYMVFDYKNTDELPEILEKFFKKWAVHSS